MLLQHITNLVSTFFLMERETPLLLLKSLIVRPNPRLRI